METEPRGSEREVISEGERRIRGWLAVPRCWNSSQVCSRVLEDILQRTGRRYGPVRRKTTTQ